MNKAIVQKAKWKTMNGGSVEMNGSVSLVMTIISHSLTVEEKLQLIEDIKKDLPVNQIDS